MGGSIQEPEFWKRLEYRICAELAGLADRQLRHYWCDSLVPGDYDLARAEPRISGVAWCGRNGQEQWQFTLITGQQATPREHINWPALLPSDQLTGWLTPDPQNKTLRIDPLSGHHG
jgi:hypothetical protein